MANKQQSVHMPYTFSTYVSVNVDGENFGEWLTICQFLPLQKFSLCSTFIIKLCIFLKYTSFKPQVLFQIYQASLSHNQQTLKFFNRYTLGLFQAFQKILIASLCDLLLSNCRFFFYIYI